MSDQVVQLAQDGTGKKVDVSELTVGANPVERQRINIADPTNATSIAAVKAASTAAVASDPALVVAVSPNNTIPVTVGRTVTYTDRSGTITTGGTAQSLMSSNSSRTGYTIWNTSTGTLYFSPTGTASAASAPIPPGALYECPNTAVPTTAISIYGATTGQSFVSWEY